MKKTIYKVISLVLIMVSMLSLLSGCGGKDNGKVELVWATGFLGTQEQEIVHKEFNKQLEKLLPNTTVKFIEFDAETWSLWMSEGKQVDIAWSGYHLDMEEEVKKGSYAALDDLIAEYGTNIKNEMKEFEADYATGQYNGKQYAIPNMQTRFSQTSSIDVPATLIQYMDVDALRAAFSASTYLTKDIMDIIDSYLEKVYASSDYDTDVVAKYIDITSLASVLATRGYGVFEAGVGYGDPADPSKIINVYETEQYKMFCEYAASWYEKGYISKDVVTIGGATGRDAVLAGEYTKTWYPTTIEGQGEERGVTYNFDDFGGIKSHSILTTTIDQKKQAPPTFGSLSTYMTIPYTSKNQERAMQLIDLLRSPKGTEGNDLLNLLCYGFEENSEEAKEYGTYHYTLTEEGQAQGVDYTLQPSKTSKYGMASWAVGNAVLAYPTPDILPGMADYVLDYKKNVVPTLPKSVYYGFHFDSTPVDTDLQNINNVLNEYRTRIQEGREGANWKSLYNTMLEKLNQAGISKVMQEMQKQADEFLKSNQ